MDAALRDTVTEARLRLKAGRGLLRDLLAAVTRLEEALDAFDNDNAQPEEAQRDHEEQDRSSERLCAA